MQKYRNDYKFYNMEYFDVIDNITSLGMIATHFPEIVVDLSLFVKILFNKIVGIPPRLCYIPCISIIPDVFILLVSMTTA